MKAIKFFALAVIFSGVSVMASAQNPTQTATADASATIVAAIEIVKEADLAFGNIVASAAGGTVKVGTNGEANRTDVAAPSIVGTVTAARFKVTGMSGSTYAITLPADDAIILKSGVNEMKLTGFINNATKILTDGSDTFNVGATLNVGANQAVGSYTATFPVIVNYN
jgi:hypothetical protein